MGCSRVEWPAILGYLAFQRSNHESRIVSVSSEVGSVAVAILSAPAQATWAVVNIIG